MKVAIVHDDLVQWGGAERVLLGISEMFPDAPIFTSVFDNSNWQLAEKFQHKQIITSFLQKIPSWREFYKTLFCLYPLSFEQFDFSGYDLVISQSTRFAKAIITRPESKHVCYCHTPPRFLWNFTADTKYNLLQPFLSYLRILDKISASRVDKFIAGSKNAHDRIKKVYRVSSEVVYPFVDLHRFAHLESFNGGYFLVISRLNKYKRVDIAIESCARLGLPLKIIGNGPEKERLQHQACKYKGIEFLGDLTDDLVAEILAGAKALVVCAVEDFGLTSLEAQALGKPVIAYGEGGCVESVIDNETGFLFDEQSTQSLTEKLKQVNLKKIDPAACRRNAQRFNKENFIKSFSKAI